MYIVESTDRYNQQVRIVPSNEKTYSTHNRARKYGQCRQPSPIADTDRWVAYPFWAAGGAGCHLYYQRPVSAWPRLQPE